MRATPAQFSKCMNTLSGATWKGAKLRVGEAKPKVTERIQSRLVKESESTKLFQERAAERYARWLRKRPWLAIEAEDLRPVSAQQVKNGEWGWKITPAGHLIRPMHMRPERPLSKPSDHTPSRKRSVPSRQQRVTIDPTRYKREHLNEIFLDASTLDSLEEIRWRCQENQDGSQQWVSIDKQGNVLSTEDIAQVRPKQVFSDEIEANPGAEWNDDDGWSLQIESNLPSSQREVPDSLFDNSASSSHAQPAASWWNEEDDSVRREQQIMSSTADPAPNSSGFLETPGQVHDTSDSLFDGGLKPATSGWWEENSAAGAAASRPTEESSDIHTQRKRAPALDESDFSDGYEEVLSDSKPTSTYDEKSHHLALLNKILPNAETELKSPSGLPLSKVGVATEAVSQALNQKDSSDRSEETADLSQDQPNTDPVLRANSPTLKTDQNKDQTSSSETFISHSNGADIEPRGEIAADNSGNVLSDTKQAPESSKLKDMFQESGTFSLFSAIADEDLDELELDDHSTEVEPVETPSTRQVPAATPMKLSALTTRTSIGHNSLLEALQRNGSQPFWCVSSDEQIEDRWKEHRAEITQSFKRMHREAVKKTRRRVAGSRAGSGTTRLGVAPALPR
ncbi:hypothetical protein MYAM1_000240 [Malassezia yamatoensis]|uniref:Uncharacterized protein n=1 Tax=Malassezia yamatoensis TaxID=253288 RepID=A0AAJ6CH74_9BASI|nr:hypothetical protein MYAM1_000240 [Malassezia yamatoensis]